MSERTIASLSRFSSSPKTAVSYASGAEWCDISFKEFDDIVRESKSFLLKFGVKKRDRVVVVAENHAKWIPMFMTITTYGAIIVPVDGQAPNSRLVNILNDSKPKLIITSKQFEPKMSVVFNDIEFKTTLVNFHFDLMRTTDEIVPQLAPPQSIAPNDPALIVYTSGTTGAPKGVTHSHHSIVSAIEHSLKVGGISPDDTMMTILPYTHVFGLINAALVPFYLGVRNVIAQTINPMELVSIIANYKVTYVCLVPRLAEIFAGLLSQMGNKFHGFKITIGGASCRHEIIEKLRSLGIKTGFGYGMTETCGGVFNAFDAPAGSVGKIHSPVSARIDKPDKDGAGELLISSPTNTIGIFGRPEFNKSLWADNSYLRTGDIAKIDKDGYVYILGRLKDVIVTPGGMNVYPDELEERIGGQPYLKEYCVIGLNDNGSEYAAFVARPDREYLAKNQIKDAQEFIEHKISEITKKWPEWEHLKKVTLLDEPLPRSYSFKVQRNSIIEILKHKKEYEAMSAEGGGGGEEEKLITEIFSGVKPLIAAHINIPPEELSIYKPLSRFNRLDSLGKMSLLAYFQHNFGLVIEEFTAEDFKTFYSFIKLLLKTNPAEKLMKINLAEKIDGMPIPVPLDYSVEGITRRQQFLKERTGADLSVLENMNYEGSEKYQGNIENFFGFCQLPLGVVGPLRVNGDHAAGDFYVPMATTEGALVASIARGAEVINLSGGANVKILADSVPRTPVFTFPTVAEMFEFSQWVRSNFDKLKAEAESTTGHGKLIAIDQYPIGTNLVLRFSYSCGDASGQNMTTIATHKAMQFIRSEYASKSMDCFLESNLSGDKKINAINFTQNRGKKVIAEVSVAKDIVKTYLKVDAERILKFYELATLGTIQAHAFGLQAHYSNPLTAIYIACGQDPACAAESAAGITQMRMQGDKLQVSVTLPDIMVGTVGGGTGLATQKSCLEIMGCHGAGKAKKMAEIVAAAVLCGEISLTASMSADDFAGAHASYGRKQGK
ncbi:MAG: Long-chain-fatty-acid--CoA ligase FadD13 [bacterium ADurb.Bin243]|nr:MAG: Long-chain-fatty-acid--CoA ligase FadD13 [bacterium ADurb.Bin243]